jgi:large subunit ribosomal protein L4
MRSALCAKQSSGALHVVDEFDFESPSTKQAVRVLEALGISGRTTVVLPDNDVNAFLSFRNIHKVRVISVSESNALDLIDNASLVFTSGSLKRIEEVLQ